MRPVGAAAEQSQSSLWWCCTVRASRSKGPSLADTWTSLLIVGELVCCWSEHLRHLTLNCATVSRTLNNGSSKFHRSHPANENRVSRFLSGFVGKPLQQSTPVTHIYLISISWHRRLQKWKGKTSVLLCWVWQGSPHTEVSLNKVGLRQLVTVSWIQRGLLFPGKARNFLSMFYSGAEGKRRPKLSSISSMPRC